MLSSVRAATPAAGHRGPPGRRGRTPGPVAKRSDRGRSDVGRVPIMSTSPDAGRCKRRTIVLPAPFPKACWSRICGAGWTGPKRTAPETRSGETGGGSSRTTSRRWPPAIPNGGYRGRRHACWSNVQNQLHSSPRLEQRLTDDEGMIPGQQLPSTCKGRRGSTRIEAVLSRSGGTRREVVEGSAGV